MEMYKMQPPDIKDIYTESDFDSLGFHDCYLDGIRWSAAEFTFCLDLDYIVKWVEPAEKEGYYSFWICPAVLSFKNVTDVLVNLDWSGFAPGCEIQDIHRCGTRLAPNGNTECSWLVELTMPKGAITLWATGFEIILKGTPTLSKTRRVHRQ